MARTPFRIAPRLNACAAAMLRRALAAQRDRGGRSEETLEQFVADLSHEFKTPLAAILGAAELLEDGAVEDTKSRTRFLRNIRREAERLNLMVKDLLEFSRLESVGLRLRPVPCALPELLDSILQKYSYLTRIEDIRLEHALEGEGASAIVDPEGLKQILFNLIDNAIDFTPKGGTVRLALRLPPGRLEIRVEDTGVGISEKNLPRIFDRFFTTERPGSTQKGTGLGLSIVSRIVEAHGGRIAVRSAPARGTCVTVEIPQPAAD